MSWECSGVAGRSGRRWRGSSLWRKVLDRVGSVGGGWCERASRVLWLGTRIRNGQLGRNSRSADCTDWSGVAEKCWCCDRMTLKCLRSSNDRCKNEDGV